MNSHNSCGHIERSLDKEKKVSVEFEPALELPASYNRYVRSRALRYVMAPICVA